MHAHLALVATLVAASCLSAAQAPCGSSTECGACRKCDNGSCVADPVCQAADASVCVPRCAGKCKGADDSCGGSCDQNACTGCCTAGLACVLSAGQSDGVCGASGAACVDCTRTGDSCAAGACKCSANCTVELDLHQATLVHIAADFADWPITAHITRLVLGLNGVHVELDNGRPDAWPDTPDRAGMGPLLYSLGLAERIGGTWYASAPIQMWRGEQENGGQIQLQDIADGTGRGQIEANWFYDARWGAMNGYQPATGETIGIFVCAGDCRDGTPAYSPVHERSNVVLLALPKSGEELVVVPHY